MNETTKPTFLVKIIPPSGYSVYRLAFTRTHLAALTAAAALALGGAVAIHSYELHVADANVHALQELTAQQQAQLKAIDAQADGLASQLHAVQRENAEIRRMIGGDHGKQHAMLAPRRRPARADGFAQVQARLKRLAHESAATKADAQRLQRLAMRVLNMRRLAALTRARLIAAIPSLTPVDGSIVDGFGYRTSPWPEFHKGVDLAADYGSQVRASAAGTVVSAGWDPGGFGIKVDIDHGNGYHTWYAHLSRVEVAPGEHVGKGQPIAFVGSTGESTGPHLHYQVMYDGNPIDPEPFLNGVPPNVLATLPDASRQ
ncbi:MAG TPA: M23 family metallopeptidase [Candidatus Limnocylindria bacterium]|nr:M23 family metallopeptidase [Candidatus Limnocylindria bacterium]